MKVVYKFEVSMYIQTVIKVPKKSKIIHADFDLNGNLCVWVLINLWETKYENRYIVPLETGLQAEKELVHINTIVDKEKQYILHVFEEIK